MAPTPMPAWRVTGQQETADLGPQGTYVPGVRVTFALADGTVGQVFVPADRYTTENVRQAIQAKADTMGEVGGLAAEA